MAQSKRFLPMAKPWLGEREIDALRRPILSGWVTQGPEVKAFEDEFAATVGSDHACAVANCTVALHLALQALGVGPGDEVITVSHSFIASANCIRYCGALPVFLDIEPDNTFNIDPEKILSAITPRTRAILCVHQMGMPCDLRAILEVARQHDLPVVEDAACAIGSEILWDGTWQKIGRPHGTIACFSFHPRKVLTTGDGGMLTTNDPDLDRRFRLLRQHAMSVPDTVRHGSRSVVFESYEELGFNYRMTDLQGAVGRVQLERLPELIARRREQASRYHQALHDIPGIEPPTERPWARSNWQSYSARLASGLDQKEIMQALLDRGIATRRGIMCAHREPAYQQGGYSCGEGPGTCGCEPGACRRLAESERAQDECILLPMFHEMSEEDQDLVIAELRDVLRNASQV